MLATQRTETRIEVEPLVYQHLAWMRLRNKRRTTIYARERMLIRLTKWAGGPILYLTAEQLERWQSDRGLGVEYGNLGQFETALGYIRKAFELKDRASEREKFAITSDYYSYTGQLDKAIQTYELYKQVYPRDERPRVNVALAYLLEGQFDKSLANALEANQLVPTEFNGYSVAAVAYEATNRLDEARAILNSAVEHKTGGFLVHEQLALVALLQGDQIGVSSTAYS